MLRICLILSIVAGLGVIYLAEVPVSEKIKTTTDERDTALKEKATALSAEQKARQEQKTAQADFEKATAQLSQKNSELDTTKRDLDTQRKRADDLFAQHDALEKDKNDAMQKLSAYTGTELSPLQILGLKDQLKAMTQQRDVYTNENMVLTRSLKGVQAELARYKGISHEVVLPAGLRGKIQLVDPKFQFVVLDIGGNQGAIRDGKLLVNRNGKLIAKVQIASVEPNRSIANILPDWQFGDVMEGDQVIY